MMKNLTTRLLFTFAVTISVLLCCAIPSLALTDGDWEFQLLDNEVKITGYLGDDKDLHIPETIYGCPVTKIEVSNYDNFNNAVTLEYPGTVKYISGAGNYNNKNLKKVILNEGTETIGSAAFKGCSNLESINLPSTITTIENAAFWDCKSLLTINLHINIQKIETAAFYNTALKSVDLNTCSENLVIEHSVFASCANLESVTWHNSIQTIPESTFSSCTSLKSVIIPNAVHTISHAAFSRSSLENIILPTSLKTIADYAFNECDFLKEAIIPYGVTNIDRDAFYGCDNLKSLYIPDTVKNIGKRFLLGSDNCIVYCSADSYAAEFCKKNEISYLTDNSVNSGITVLYNGSRISFHSYGQNPELYNGRTLVPLRSIFEAMGADVEWDQTTQTVTAKRDGITIKITIGQSEMYKNGSAIALDVPAMLIGGRTLVPVRVIAEAFGAEVEWNNNGRVVLITE